MNDNIACPLCGSPASKAMYAGIPLKLCADPLCGYCWGCMAWIMEFIPFNGWMIRYEHYWLCLWEFLTGVSNEKASKE